LSESVITAARYIQQS